MGRHLTTEDQNRLSLLQNIQENIEILPDNMLDAKSKKDLLKLVKKTQRDICQHPIDTKRVMEELAAIKLAAFNITQAVLSKQETVIQQNLAQVEALKKFSLLFKHVPAPPDSPTQELNVDEEQTPRVESRI